MWFAVAAIIECELLSRFGRRLLACRGDSAAYLLKGADWVGVPKE